MTDEEIKKHFLEIPEKYADENARDSMEWGLIVTSYRSGFHEGRIIERKRIIEFMKNSDSFNDKWRCPPDLIDWLIENLK